MSYHNIVSSSASSTLSPTSTARQNPTIENNESAVFSNAPLNISKFLINTTLMGSAETIREFTVTGKQQSKFTIIAVQDGTLKYYNFEDGVFELGHTSKSNLKITMSAGVFRGRIIFPSGGGTYVVKLLTGENTVFKNRSTVASRNIEKQAAEATLTLSPATANSDNYQTFPTTASTGDTSSSTKTASNWLVKNSSNDGFGFGLKIILPEVQSTEYGFENIISENFFDNCWYSQTQKAVVSNLSGDGVDSSTITVADTSGLSIGMTLYYLKSTTSPVNQAGEAIANSVIASIDSALGEIKFTHEVAFEDGETMTLRAYGSKAIYYNTGAILSFGQATLTAPLLQKTVRADSDGDLTPSQTITLTDTHGLSGGNTIKYAGLGVDNSGTNAVNVVTPDCPDLTSSGALDNDGAITVQLTQTLKQGTVLSFIDIYSEATIIFDTSIKQFPESSTNLYLDLNKIFSVGVSGS